MDQITQRKQEERVEIVKIKQYWTSWAVAFIKKEQDIIWDHEMNSLDVNGEKDWKRWCLRWRWIKADDDNNVHFSKKKQFNILNCLFAICMTTGPYDQTLLTIQRYVKILPFIFKGFKVSKACFHVHVAVKTIGFFNSEWCN